MLLAAADVVAVADAAASGPSLRLLQGAAAQLAPLEQDAGAAAALLDDGIVFPTVDAALAASTDEVRRRGAAARRQVEVQFSLDGVVARWAGLLGSVHRRGMDPSTAVEGP